MEIVLHLGVHLTDNEKLVQCLIRNRELLAAEGIAAPPPATYRHQLRALAHDLRNQPTDAETQEALLDGLLDADEVRRVVLSWDHFMGEPNRAFAENRLYPDAGGKIAQLRRLFPEARVQVYLAIRNPAFFLPALAADHRAGGVQAALKAADPASVHWSELLARLQAAVPDVPITVWCDEDTPLLWPEILRAVSGHTSQTPLVGWFGWYWGFMTPKSHEVMRRYFGQNPITDDLHRRRVLSAMLEKFAKPEALDPGPSLPGWDEAYTDALTDIYEQDVDLISAMPGITLLEP